MSSWISLDFVEFGEHYAINSDFPHDIININTSKLKKGKIEKDGYIRFSFWENGKRKEYNHHRLIYYALVKPFDLNDKNLVIDHINGNRSDNHINNLRLVTQSVNTLNKRKHKGYVYNFVKELPDKIIVNEEHKIYYSPLNDKFYRDLSVHLRSMNEVKIGNCIWIRYIFQRKQYNINVTKWRKENGY